MAWLCLTRYSTFKLRACRTGARLCCYCFPPNIRDRSGKRITATLRACVRICVYVHAYLCNVCVGGVGGGGGGGAGVVRAFVYMHVTMDVRMY